MCGKQTTDGDTAQVGAEVAEYLKIPNVSNVTEVKYIKDGEIFLTSVIDNKIMEMAVKLPCLISTETDINSPRLPSYKIKKTLNETHVKFVSMDDFADQNANNYGLNGSATQVERIFPPEKNMSHNNSQCIVPQAPFFCNDNLKLFRNCTILFFFFEHFY